MTEDEALAIIQEGLNIVLEDRAVVVNKRTDLIEEEILDSVDSMVFSLEVENLSGKKFPTDGDLVEMGYFKVEKLIELLTT